jgi:triphosphoribosyl-dephospho-CoA synthase
MSPPSTPTLERATRSPLQLAVLRACRADVEAFKPGNVAVGMPAHRMTADDFQRSATVVVGPLTDAHSGLGARIEAAVAATVAAVGCNTNLGIVLLLAPLVAAAMRAQANDEAPQAWRWHLPAVLSGTTAVDGLATARAILRAHPAGLGAAPEADVSAAAGAGPGFRHTLFEAMALAASRDLIAQQYTSGFATVGRMADRLSGLMQGGASRNDAVTASFLRQLVEQPDSHIRRKHGDAMASAVSAQVSGIMAGLPDPPHWSPAMVRSLTELHDRLLLRGINPGTTADLTVAAVFVTELDAMQKF